MSITALEESPGSTELILVDFSSDFNKVYGKLYRNGVELLGEEKMKLKTPLHHWRYSGQGTGKG